MATVAAANLLKPGIESRESLLQRLLLFGWQRSFRHYAERILKNFQKRLPPALFNLSTKTFHSHSAVSSW
jgi:hypothetical protein